MTNFKHISPEKLPDGWSVSFLENLVTYNLGRTPSRNDRQFWDNGVYPWVTIADMSPYRTVIDTKEKVSEEAHSKLYRGRLVPAGTLLMSFKLTIGRVAKLGIAAYHNEAIISIFLKDKNILFDEYLFYYLSQIDYSQYQDTAVKGMTLNKGKIDRLEIVLPPISEQRRIAYIMKTVQTAVMQLERLIALTGELKFTLMRKLFSEGLRGEKQKETEIGLVPASWDVLLFSEGVDIKNGQVDPRVEPYSHMIHVGPENIERQTGRFLSLKTNKELGIMSGNYWFNSDDILYSKIRPYLNKVALPDFEGTCSADMYPLRVKKEQFDKFFLFQFMLSETFNKQAISHQDRTGIPKINRDQLGSITLPKPTLDEQIEIAESLRIFDIKIAMIEKKRNLLEELFRTLLHQLMTAQIRVNNIDIGGIS